MPQRLKKPEPKRVGHPKHPWATMAVGEMFFVPHDRNTMVPLAWSSGKRLGRKFSTRMVWMLATTKRGWKPCKDDHPDRVRGIGVWRDA